MKEKKIICRSLSLLLSAASLVGCLSSVAIPASAANHGEVLKIENLQEPMETKPGYTGPVGELIKLENHTEEFPEIKIFGEKIDFENKEEEEPTKIIPCVISFGDSYSSGEGLAPYYGSEIPHNNTVDEDWVSHRSQNSWPGRLKVPDIGKTPLSQSKSIYTKPYGQNLGNITSFPNWFFLAISGAETEHYYYEFPKSMFRSHGTDDFDHNFLYHLGTTNVAPENQVFTDIKRLEASCKTSDNKPVEYNIEYVTMTLGGNDVGFTDVVTTALFGTYSSLESLLDERLDVFKNGNSKVKPTDEFGNKIPAEKLKFLQKPIKDRLYEIYVNILEQCDAINACSDTDLKLKAHLIIAGYPRLFNTEDIDASEKALVKNAFHTIIEAEQMYGIPNNLMINDISDEAIDAANHALHPYSPGIGGLDAELIDTKIQEFNTLLEEVVKEVQKNSDYADRIHFVSVYDRFYGYEAYSSWNKEQMIRDLSLLKDEDLNNQPFISNGTIGSAQLPLPDIKSIVSAASVHPTDAGADAYSKAVQTIISALDISQMNSRINVYITDGKQYAPEGYRVSIKDAYGVKVDAYLTTDENITYTEATAIKPGRYLITVENGKNKMTVVRTIKDNEVAEFTFVVDKNEEKNADICLYLTDGESYIHDRVNVIVRNTAGESINLYADGNAVRSEALNPGQYLITASYGGKTLNVVREIKEGTNNFTILADRSDEKKAAIQLYATNDKKEDALNKVSFSIESVFGATPATSKQSGSSGDSCLRSEALLPGTYRITAANAGKTMSIVRKISAGTSEFTFVVSSAHTPEETVQALEDAMNAMDQRALLACFDSDLNDLYDGALEIIGFFTDMDLGWIDGATTVLGGMMAQMGYTPQITMKVTNVTYTSSEKDCIVDILYTASMEELGSESEMMQLPMHLDGEYWLISMSNLDQIMSLF